MASQRPEEEQAEKAFTISDKRLFNKDGARRPESRARRRQRVHHPRRLGVRLHGVEPPRSRRAAARTGRCHADLPAADFSTFVIMLANTIMVSLGQVPDPMTQQRRRDLPHAQHTIDILMMLQEKTRGNLTQRKNVCCRSYCHNCKWRLWRAEGKPVSAARQLPARLAGGLLLSATMDK